MSTEDDTKQDAPDKATASVEEPAKAGKVDGPTSAEAPVASLGISDAIKESVAEYIAEHDVKTEAGGQLNLDWDFVRNHGGPLMAHLFASVTKQLLPENLNFSIPAPKKSEADPDAAAKPGGVNVNFDLGDFLGKLFKGPQGGDPPKGR